MFATWQSSVRVSHQVRALGWDPVAFVLVEQAKLWELHHLFPGSSGKGSARSDFAAVFVNNYEVHKDNAVIVAEAAFELNKIFSVAPDLSPEEVVTIRVHIGLINDTVVITDGVPPHLADRTTAHNKPNHPIRGNRCQTHRPVPLRRV